MILDWKFKMPDLARALEFLEKADKRLGWLDAKLDDMHRLAEEKNIGDFEEKFVGALYDIDASRQALCDAAKKVDRPDLREQLLELVEGDPLLRYLSMARNNEDHDALVKWSDGMEQGRYKIVDQEKANMITQGCRSQLESLQALYRVAYGVKTNDAMQKKMLSGRLPSAEGQARAGIELEALYSELALRDFKTGQGKKKKTIIAPTEHLGKPHPNSALEATRSAIAFYRDWLKQLKALAI